MSSDGFQGAVAKADSYHVGDVVPVSGFDTVSAGTNVLISGPPMLGKRRLALELLATGASREHAIAITPDTDGDRLRTTYEGLPNGNAERFHVIDCTGATGKGSMDDTEAIKYVGSPGDLTGIGMGIVKCTRDIGREVEAGLRLSVLSLSTILQYANSQRMFNFLHTVTGRVSAANYLGVATLDPTTQDTQEVNTLTSLFDAVVELREADDGTRETRVVGLPDVPRTWVSF
jgi:KaiC/GvpD/RAD55 family RecA-like ATPase